MLDNFYYQIPKHTYDSLKLYVEKRISPGGFLYAVLTNDLFKAICSANSENLKMIKEICWFVYNEMPFDSWGSVEKVKKWLGDGK